MNSIDDGAKATKHSLKTLDAGHLHGGKYLEGGGLYLEGGVFLGTYGNYVSKKH